MKKIRFALFLPLLHLAIVTPAMLIREVWAWKYAPIAQQAQDYDQGHPVDTGGLILEPCYEYRASNATRLIFAANFPTAFLIGTPDGCPQSALQHASAGVRFHLSVKKGIVLRGSLIVIGVITQWWLIGRWLDHRHRQPNRLRRWFVPVAIITVAGAVMVPTAFFSGESAEVVNAVSGILALLAWIILVVMFLASGVAWGIKKIGTRDPNVRNSPA